MDRYKKTKYLSERWFKEQGIDLILEEIEYKIKWTMSALYDKLPISKIDEMYNEVALDGNKVEKE